MASFHSLSTTICQHEVQNEQKWLKTERVELAWGGSLGNPGHSADGACVLHHHVSGIALHARARHSNDVEPVGISQQCSKPCMPVVPCNKTATAGRSHSLVQWDMNGWQRRRRDGQREWRRTASSLLERKIRPDRYWNRRDREGREVSWGREWREFLCESRVSWESSCTWLESTHLRYIWAPFWALRAHYRRTEQNTETITHRDINTRSSKNLRLSCLKPPAVGIYKIYTELGSCDLSKKTFFSSFRSHSLTW